MKLGETNQERTSSYHDTNPTSFQECFKHDIHKRISLRQEITNNYYTGTVVRLTNRLLAIQRRKNIRRIEIISSPTNQETYKQKLWNDPYSILPKLENLELVDIGDSGMTQPAREFIIGVLNSKRAKIKSFKIRFYTLGFNKLDTRIFTRELFYEISKNLYNLQDLEISLFGYQLMGDYELYILWRILKYNSQNFQGLRLRLNYSEISDSNIQCLSKALLLGCNKLEKLYLDFDLCRKISTNGIEHLSEAFHMGIPRLKFISLSFSFCFKITSEGSKFLYNAICTGRPSLKKLFLDFHCGSHDGRKILTDIFSTKQTKIINLDYKQ